MHTSLAIVLAVVAGIAVSGLQAQTSETLTAELAEAVDAFVLDRWSDADPAPLGAKLKAAGVDAAALETMLRAGRPHYPEVAAPRGELSARLPLASDHLDHATQHYVYVPKSYDPIAALDRASAQARASRGRHRGPRWEHCWGPPRTRILARREDSRDYGPKVATPLLVVGHGGSAARDLDFGARAARGGMVPFWLEAAERHGFLVVAPLSDRGWMQIGTSLLFSAISRMQRDFHVDPDRIFLTGHSMGPESRESSRRARILVSGGPRA